MAERNAEGGKENLRSLLDWFYEINSVRVPEQTAFVYFWGVPVAVEPNWVRLDSLLPFISL